MLKHKNSHGFTIVELLVVIVVIGILASITVVAYNGIQERALNTARISAAKQTLQLLKSYKAIHDSYPIIPEGVAAGTRGACIGTGWPITQERAVCWNIYPDGHLGASTFFEDVAVNTELAKIGSVPTFPKNIVSKTTDSQGRDVELAALALIERTNTSNSLFQLGYSLAYLLRGDTDCDLPGAVKSQLNDATRCIIHLGPSND